MRKMKDSGVKWIGNIPAEWRTAEIKNYCKEVYAGGTPQSSNMDYWDGDIPWIPSGTCHDCKISSAPKSITKKGFENSSTKMIPAYSAVLAMTGATCGNTGYLTFDSCANQSVTAYVSKKDTYSLFLWYLLQAARDYILTFQTGGAQGGINVENCKNLVVPFITYSEQRRIADYLDSKCFKIDEIIAKQEKIIEKLKEYKLSVITEAVTKGINPYVEMIDSGVNWIGAIPQDWRISKMKYLGRFINGFAFPSNAFSESGIKVMKIANIQPMHIDWGESSYVQGYSLEQMDNYKVNRDDLVFALTRPIINGGIKVAIADFDEDVLLNQRNAMFKGGESISVKWQYYLMQNKMFIQEFALYIDGTGQQPNISTNEISNIDIPLPSLEEQRIITDYLDKKMNEIDKQIQVYISITEKLKEYKKSLIYEVVTGKKEV